MQFRTMTKRPRLAYMARWDGSGFRDLEEFRVFASNLHLGVDDGACGPDRYVAHLNWIMYLRYEVASGTLSIIGPRDSGGGRVPAFGDWVVCCPESAEVVISDASAVRSDFDQVS